MITNDNKTASTPAFQARLDINALKLGRTGKVRQVQQLFSEKTQHYANDVLELRGVKRQIDEDGQFYHAVEVLTNGKDVTSFITGDLKKFFANNTVDDIVKSFVRLFKKGKADEVFGNQLGQIDRNISRASESRKANSIKAAFAKQNGNTVVADRCSTIARNNEARINVLEGEKAKVNDRYKAVKDSITDDKLFGLNGF